MKNFVKPLAHCLVQCYRGPFKSGVDFNSYCAMVKEEEEEVK